MSLQDAKKFVARFVTEEYGPGEQAAFLKWLRGAPVQEWDSVADEHEAFVERWPVTAIAPSAEWTSRLERRLDGVQTERQVPVVGIGEFNRSLARLKYMKGWVAAASVAGVIAVGTLLYTHQGKSKAGVGQSEGVAPVPVSMLSVNVPMGGQARQVILTDGSKIVLNSASTLKYPASFNGPERVVELSGEAFFDVANDAGKPFKVMIRGAEVDVLGTKFDVMAYEDEPACKTTLIDGAVKVKSGTKEVMLKPGDQLQVNYPLPGAVDGMTMQFNPDVNAVNVSSWLKGGIDFEDADVKAVMRSLSRYYNVKIVYPKDLRVRKTITVGYALQDGLPKNLERLEQWFHLTFKKDGNIVTVTSQ